MGGEGEVATDGELPRRVLGADPGDRFADDLQALLCRLQELLPFRRQLDPAGRAAEQGAAQALLDLSDLAADRRLGDAEGLAAAVKPRAPPAATTASRDDSDGRSPLT